MSNSNALLDRRKLLQAGAAAFAAGSLPLRGSHAATHERSSQQDTAQEKKFKKAVKIGMVKLPKDEHGKPASLLKKFQVLKELGFDGVELDSPGGPKPDEVKEAIDQTGLPVHGVVDSIHWNKTLSHPDPKVREEGLEGLKTAIRASKAYGGTSVLLVPGVCNQEANYEQAWERSIPEIKKALPLADKLEIDILLENVWNNFLTDPKETAKYIDELDSPRVGAYYDVGNSVRYATPVEWVETLGHRIKKLDIKEYDLEKGKAEGWYKGFRVKLLEGSCDWPATMAALKKIGFSGWGTAEIPGGDRKRLKEIAERMDRIFKS